LDFKKTPVIRRFSDSAGGEREAISLAPRLQPGDNKKGIDKEPFLTVFCWQANEEKLLETVLGIIF
jgi:hypothetical protein